MEIIQSNNYPIYFDNSIVELVNFIKQSGYSRFFIFTDENTGKYCLPVVKEKIDQFDNYDIIEINAGEESKNIDFCIGVWKMLIDFGADRNSLIINLGGGVISDMGGFVASTYKRGIDFVHIPTTLLSQVDASVGGKTGIDIEGIKNIVGTFAQPKAVFMINEFLKTLPPRQILSGLAELLKHGLIADAQLWADLKQNDLTQPSPELIHRSVKIKNKIVLEDPTEKNIRKALNFGHTIGHAVETYSLLNDQVPLSHGEAIAIGMICEAWLSNKNADLPDADLQDITATLTTLYPKYQLHENNFDALFKIMQMDKKNLNGKINCTFLTRIGQFSIDNICTEEELYNSLRYYAAL
ncbi:3-dehydroquinate synthase [Mucilaginibacter segetis]|uniref:3-dehydroquinate synthase n=1 Tax=Mucilaginibacter segetis TaxID=2793071 RepID=A0A934PUB0_9SPHI|nr:3-dehydroquinate synthase [Mucilaginibacter segetis]MBK0379153.1 3-dehydroquinate synthase [Mucilaginibacter segetis]